MWTIIHRTCHSHWIFACHTRGNSSRCPICRGDLQGQPEGPDSTATGEEGRTSGRRCTPSGRPPQEDGRMNHTSNYHAEENEGSRHRGDDRNRQRVNRPVPDMDRWADILASFSGAQWHGKTDQLPPKLIQVLVNDLCPAALIRGRQHTLAENLFGSR